MSEPISIPHDFYPRDYQRGLFKARKNGIDRFIWFAHRRAGKDTTCLNFMVQEMFRRVGTYFYVFPTFTQAKRVIWDGIRGDGKPFLSFFPQETIRKRNDSELRIELINGSVFMLVGSDSVDGLVGTNPVGCVFSEWPLHDPSAWDYLRPILAENKGWALFNGTARGKNHAWKMLQMAKENPKWWWEVLTVDDTKRADGTPVITPEAIEDERKAGMSEEMIRQEFYNDFDVAMVGSYFSERIREMEAQKRIGYVPWEEMHPVETYWDLGMNDEMAIWFVQQRGYSYHLIDCEHGHGKGFEYYAKIIRSKPYNYSRHCIPHDGTVRELGTGTERSKTLDSMLREPVEVLRRPKGDMDKIEAIRWFLPKCYIDLEKCEYGINAIKNYRQEYDERGKTWKDRPNHDWTSHMVDALAYLALDKKENINVPDQPIVVPSSHDDIYSAI